MPAVELNETVFAPLVDSDLTNLAESLAGRNATEAKPASPSRAPQAQKPAFRTHECRPIAAGGMFATLHPECSQEYAERFQLLRTQLMLHRSRVLPAVDFRTLAVMSTHRGEGKSFTATNMASTLAANSRQGVLLIDANPEGPELPLGVDTLKGGFTQALEDPEKWHQSVYGVKGSTLCVMPRGRAAGRSLDLSQIQRLLAQLRRQFEWVVLDGTSFASCPDAEWLSAVTDGSLLVTQRGSVEFDTFQDSLIKIPEGRLVGVVFNERTRPTDSLRVRLRFSGKWQPRPASAA